MQKTCLICERAEWKDRKVRIRGNGLFVCTDIKCREVLLEALIKCILDHAHLSKETIVNEAAIERLESLWRMKFEAAFYKELHHIASLLLIQPEDV